MYFLITRDDKSVDPFLYNWDERTKTLSTKEADLVLNFKGIDNVNFITGSRCKFETGSGCTFNTNDHCLFNTSFYCMFNTGAYCTFKTSSHCIFYTSFNCIFKTGKKCIIVRRDNSEVIHIVENVRIKLNGSGAEGYTILPYKETIMIAGKKYYKNEVERKIKKLQQVI